MGLGTMGSSGGIGAMPGMGSMPNMNMMPGMMGGMPGMGSMNPAMMNTGFSSGSMPNQKPEGKNPFDDLMWGASGGAGNKPTSDTRASISSNPFAAHSGPPKGGNPFDLM